MRRGDAANDRGRTGGQEDDMRTAGGRHDGGDVCFDQIESDDTDNWGLNLPSTRFVQGWSKVRLEDIAEHYMVW